MNCRLPVLIALGVVVFPALSQAQTLHLINQGPAGLAIDGGTGGARKQNVELEDADESNDSQQWVEHYRGNDFQGNEFYAYEKLGSNFCIDGNNGGEDNQNVYLWDCSFSTENQHWLKVDLGNGYFRLQKRNAPGYFLAGVDENLVLQSSNNSSNQSWLLKSLTNDDNEGPGNTGKVDVSATLNDAVPSPEEAAAFLTQATFGPTEDSIAQLQDMGYSAWFKDQLAKPIVNILDETYRIGAGQNSSRSFHEHPLEAFFDFAIEGDDQLRQRAAYALSQIFATNSGSADITRKSLLDASYKEIVQRGAFGNFRDLLTEVTYHPLMGYWLTYAGNKKADPVTGSSPDENYARELMQLFTIGLLELNNDGSPRLSGGQPIETYDNNDVVELAKIFTGLHFAGLDFGRRMSYHNAENDTLPMEMHNEHHSSGTKTFLNSTVPDLGDGDAEISAALDILFAHKNVAPFICAQLIQRLTLSNPHGRNYTKRCSAAFNDGEYTLPDGSVIGNGERGDLRPVWAAILLDSYSARNPNRGNWKAYGKVREPIVGFIHWARVADVDNTDVEGTTFRGGWHNSDFGQTPYQPESVFNFYRPGYVPTGTSIGALGKVAPELQIFNATTIINYANAMRSFNLRAFDADTNGFIPKFTREVELAENAEALTNHLNLVMTAGRMDNDTVRDMISAIESVALSDNTNQRKTDLLERVVLAMQLTVTSSEFRTQH